LAEIILRLFQAVKYLQKTWVRIVVSLVAGGFISEIIHINTGDPNRPSTSGESYLLLISAFITFFVLTTIVNKKK